MLTPYNEDDRNIETIEWKFGKLTPPTGIYSTTYDLSRFLIVQLQTYMNLEKENILFLTNNTRVA